MAKLLNAILASVVGIITNLTLMLLEIAPVNDVNKSYMLGCAIFGLAAGSVPAILEITAVKEWVKKSLFLGIGIWISIGLLGSFCMIALHIVARGDPSPFVVGLLTFAFNSCLFYMLTSLAINLEGVENLSHWWKGSGKSK